MQDYLRILSDFCYELSYNDLPENVVELTKLYIMDYYAAAMAGIKINRKFSTVVYDIIEQMGGAEECETLFNCRKLPVANAAFVNAVYAHGADMDDGNRKAMGHVGAHVISTAFAVGELYKSPGKEIITAINVGYEVYNRAAAAAQPGLVHRGFHSTGTAGAIACAAVAAKLMKLDRDMLYNAMSIAGIQASGLIIIAESGQSCKPINPANAAKTGILSAKIAEKGIEAPVNLFESKKGWMHAMCDDPDYSQITNGLGSVFTITESYIKPYPSCRHTHCGIECALNLFHKINGRSIKSVKVYIYKNAIQIAGQIEVPKSPDECKFSIHYSLATALINGSFGLSDLTTDIKKNIIDLIQKIELIEDPAMENRDAGIRGAKMSVELDDGEIISDTVLIPKGDAANPFSFDDMIAKMKDCGDGIFGNVELIQKKIMEFENIDNFRSINVWED